jgi:hypothetical protein
VKLQGLHSHVILKEKKTFMINQFSQTNIGKVAKFLNLQISARGLKILCSKIVLKAKYSYEAKFQRIKYKVTPGKTVLRNSF